MSAPPPASTSPTLPQAVVFVDGQNLRHAAEEAFGCGNYHPVLLADTVCADRRWECVEIHFYSGIFKSTDNLSAHNLWVARKRSWSRDPRIKYFTPYLLCRSRNISFDKDEQNLRLMGGLRLGRGAKVLLSDGTTVAGELTLSYFQEKGVDVRIAVDLVQLTNAKKFDVAVIFSQDQDLAEAVTTVKQIAGRQSRSVELYSAFPSGTSNQSPIKDTKPLPVSRECYDKCIDQGNYSSRR